MSIRPARRPLFALALLAALAAAPGAQAAGGKEAKPAKEGGRKLTSAESYIGMSGLTAAVSVYNPSAGFLHVDVSFDAPDAAQRAKIEKNSPRLRDALRSALADYANLHYRRGAPPDLERLKRMLQTAAERELGGPGVQVLLANVMVQK